MPQPDIYASMSDALADATPADWKIKGAVVVMVCELPDGLEGVLSFERGDIDAAAEKIAEINAELNA